MVKSDVTAGSQSFTPEWFAEVSQDLSPADTEQLACAVEWGKKRLDDLYIFSGETCIAHACGTVKLLSALQMDVTSMTAAIVATIPNTEADKATKKSFREEIISNFGLEVYNLVQGSHTLIRVGAVTTFADVNSPEQEAVQQEMQRKMLLAMAADLRIVVIRLVSRLQSLRWYSESKTLCPPVVAQQTRAVYAPLANRLGIWQIKWELEDLAFRFTDPDNYHAIAQKLESRRMEREEMVRQIVSQLTHSLDLIHIKAEVSGRAKHIFSIYNKMRNKKLKFEQLYDLLAIRVIVEEERECYSVLAMVHSQWAPVLDQFDDYIANPKPNGYRSLHTVVRDDEGRMFELQIRTRKMHEFSEFGMAAHWRYKESGAQGGKTKASSLYDRQISWLRQLLSWKKEVGLEGNQQTQIEGEAAQATGEGAQPATDASQQPPGHDKVYVLTPQAKVIELPYGSTALDFAYHLHTDLGHRCRGARVDGQMQAINKPLQTGQTVEIISAKSGAPSRDWLNPQLGYLASPRARSKVRLWFNAIELQQRISFGHDQVEKELQKLGKTATNLEKLAQSLGFAKADDLYVAVAKDEFSLRNIAKAFAEEPVPQLDADGEVRQFVSSAKAPKGSQHSKGVLVVGVDSLMTQLAKCCHPAPPDAITGFVTRGRGVSIHRENCNALKVLAQKHPERIIEVSWGEEDPESLYTIELSVVAQDQKDLYREVIEAFSKLKVSLVNINTQKKENSVYMHFTVEVQDGDQIQRTLAALSKIQGVISAHRS